MKNVLLAMSIMITTACLTPEPEPTAASEQSITEPESWGPKLCSTLGCPLKPSGSPDIWEPCPDDWAWCYCGSPAVQCINDRYGQ